MSKNNPLADARKRAGLSQTQLSKVSGVGVVAISKIERGVALLDNTTLKNAIKLADALYIQDLRDLVR